MPKVPYDIASRLPWQRVPFPAGEYERRVEELERSMATAGLDALLIYGCGGDDASVRWLTNFVGSTAQTLVLVRPGVGPRLWSNWLLHGEPMHSMFWNTWLAEAHPAGSGADAALLACEHLGGARRIGVAGWDLVPAVWMEALRSRFPTARFESADALLLGLRVLKHPLEIAVMRRSAAIAGAAMQAAMDACRPRVTEFEVAAAAHEVIFRLGAEDLAFDTAVVAGPRAGLKHGGPSARPMEAGDMVFLDLGAKLDGYHSDLSRTIVVGEASAEQRRFLATAERMFASWMEQGGPGSTIGELQESSARIAVEEGYEDEFQPLGWGHGLGTHLFERPFLTWRSTEALVPGMVFALEPMLVRLGFGTAVMEETVLVTEKGLEALSGLPTRIYS